MNPANGPVESLNIRRAQRSDAAALLQLIVALAEFEKLAPPDDEARQRLIEDGFGPRPRFECWLGCWKNEPQPVAYSLFFETYSSFLARPTLYLEDIFVLPAFRHRGIGTAMLEHSVGLARERGCGRMEWTCLDWNTKAQAAYKQFGARQMREWFLYRLDLLKDGERISHG